METVLLYCGTFNPIHKGHLHLLRQAAEQVKADLSIVIPAGNVHHKFCCQLASPEDRGYMCTLALANLERAEVSWAEISDPQFRYTWETVSWFRKRYREARLLLLMGSDTFLTIGCWRNVRQIFEEAELCVAVRKGDPEEQVLACCEKYAALGCRTRRLTMDTLPISSSMIRKRIASGEDVSDWLDAGVYRYIMEKSLYRERPGWKAQ